MMPKTGTTLDIASGTLFKATCHPPIAKVVIPIKNMLALVIIKKNTLFCNSTAQNRVLFIFSPWAACSNGWNIINPYSNAITPAPIRPIVHFL